MKHLLHMLKPYIRQLQSMIQSLLINEFLLTLMIYWLTASQKNNLNKGEHCMSDKCIYCGSISSAGSNCTKSPTKGHVKPSDGKHCIYCGSISPVNSNCT